VAGSLSFAVYNQIVWNFSQTGSFQQNIHSFYADDWKWSGHLSPSLFVVGWLYGLAPGPLTLCWIQISAVALGALPAFGLGWRAFGGPLGGVAAMLLYLGYPPLIVLALADYQDLVLGIPFAVAAVHQAWRGRPWAFALALLGVAASREEWILVVPLLGLLAPGGWSNRLTWAARALVVALFYFGALFSLGFQAEAVRGPLAPGPGIVVARLGLPTTWSGALERARRILAPIHYQSREGQQEDWKRTWLGARRLTRTWDDVVHFYLDLGTPVHLVGVFAPTALMPAAAGLAVHLTAPPGIGVDANWANQVHHLAPVAASVVLAALLGSAFCHRRTAGRRGLWAGLALVALALVVHVNLVWARRLDLHLRFHPVRHSARPPVPEWDLVAGLPPDASLATDTAASLVISSRQLAYTYDDSFRDKVGCRGLRAVDYLLVRKAHAAWVREALSLPGVQRVGETRGYLLLRMPWAAPSVEAAPRV